MRTTRGPGGAADVAIRVSPATQSETTLLSASLWLHAPLATLVLLHIVSAFAPQVYATWVIPEDGIIETATPAILIVAIAMALRTLREEKRVAMRLWLVVFAFGCIYFAGEEVSWGQRVLGWQTPETWRALNKQEELNIHNVSAIFDSKPRLLLSLAVLVGGILYPLVPAVRRLLDRFVPAVFWPAWICVPSAALALTVGTPERIAQMFDIAVPAWLVIGEPGEVKELYLALFLMLYATGIRGSRKLRA